MTPQNKKAALITGLVIVAVLLLSGSLYLISHTNQAVRSQLSAVGAISPGGPFLSTIPDPAYTGDACSNSTNKSVCYKAFYRFSCSQPVAIYDNDSKVFTTNPFDANKGASRLTAPCADFCYLYAKQAGFADENACRVASVDFQVGNPVLSSNTNEIKNLATPLNIDYDTFSFSSTKAVSYCNQILTDMAVPLSHNWNRVCNQAISDFLTASTPIPTWNGYKLVGLNTFLKGRMFTALWARNQGAADLCVKTYGKKVVARKMGYLAGSDPDSSEWQVAGLGCCADSSACLMAGQCYAPGQTTTYNGSTVACSATDTPAYGKSSVWCPQGLSNGGRGQCLGSLGAMVSICLSRGDCIVNKL